MSIQDRIIRVKSVSEIVGLSVSTIYRLERRGHFPRRIRIPGSIRTGWSLSSINEYLHHLKSPSEQVVLVHSKTWRAANQTNQKES